MNMLFPVTIPALPVSGEDKLYPVRRIFCVARNYAAHAREMGADPSREPPFYFTKSACCLVPNGGEIPFAPATENLQHEVELVVAIGAPVFQANRQQAENAVFGFGVGLDLTRRDLQFAARDAKRPWDLGKNFEYSAPCSTLVRGKAPTSGVITLDVNGQQRQKGDLSDMIWSVPEVIMHLSGYYHLEPGDLIFTGTPEGVSPLAKGDHLVGKIEGVGQLEVTLR